MDLKDFLAISGKPGLYKFVSQGRNVMIVENLETGKKSSAFNTDKVIALADIAVFTADEEVPLHDVFKSVFEKEQGGSGISHKSDPEELKVWFAGILPDYDRERVYVSDIKKIVRWYNIMQKLELLDFNEKESESGKEAEKEDAPPKTQKQEPKKASKKSHPDPGMKQQKTTSRKSPKGIQNKRISGKEN